MPLRRAPSVLHARSPRAGDMKPATAGDENGFHLVPAREYARYAGHIITADARNIQNFKVRVV